MCLCRAYIFKLSPFHTNWRRLAMHWRPTILDTSPMPRQTSPDNVSTLPSHRQRSSAVVNASSSLAIFLECSKKSPSLANGRQWIKRRQSVVSALPTIAKLRQQLANASLTDRQCFCWWTGDDWFDLIWFGLVRCVLHSIWHLKIIYKGD